MLYEAGRTGKNIQVKLYFIPVDIIIELGDLTVISSITGVSCKDRKETYTQHEFCAKKDTWRNFVPVATAAWHDAAAERETNMGLEAAELF